MINYTRRQFRRKSEKYVSGRMELEEMIVFEDYLDENPTRKMMVEGMCINYNIFDGKPPKIPTTFNRHLRKAKVVGFIILLLVAGTFLVKSSLTSEPDNQPPKLVNKPAPIKPADQDKTNLKDSLAVPDVQKSNKKPETTPKPKKIQRETISPRLLAINKEEIEIWESELNSVVSYRGGDDIEVLSLKSNGNRTILKIRYVGNDLQASSQIYLTIFSAKNMAKPLADETPLQQAKGKQRVFSKTLTLPVNNTYYWKITNEEEQLFIGKLIK